MTMNWKSRKLWAAIVTLVVTLLVTGGVIGEVEGEALATTIMALLGILGLYVAGNVGEHAAKKGGGLALTDPEKDILMRALADAQERVKSPDEKDKGWTDIAGDALKGVAGKLIPFL